MFDNYDPKQPYMEKVWTLRTSDFFSKWGFNESQLFDCFLDDNQISMPFPVEILEHVLEAYVMPLLPNHIKFYKANTSHNKFRIYDKYKGEVPNIEITISAEQLFALYDE